MHYFPVLFSFFQETRILMIFQFFAQALTPSAHPPLLQNTLLVMSASNVELLSSLPFHYASHSSFSSTRTITLCLSLLCEAHSPVLSLHVSVEQRFLSLQTAGQGHEDRVDVLTFSRVLC